MTLSFASEQTLDAQFLAENAQCFCVEDSYLKEVLLRERESPTL